MLVHNRTDNRQCQVPRHGRFHPARHRRQAAKDWIDRNQLGRRNLNPDTASLLRGRIYNRTKKAAHDGGKGGTRSGDQNDPHFTATKLSKTFGVGEATIERDGQVARAVEVVKQSDPTIEQRVHSGKISKQSVVAAAKVMGHSAMIAHPRSRNASPQATNRICATTEAVMDICHRES